MFALTLCFVWYRPTRRRSHIAECTVRLLTLPVNAVCRFSVVSVCLSDCACVADRYGCRCYMIDIMYFNGLSVLKSCLTCGLRLTSAQVTAFHMCVDDEESGLKKNSEFAETSTQARVFVVLSLRSRWDLLNLPVGRRSVSAMAILHDPVASAKTGSNRFLFYMSSKLQSMPKLFSIWVW